MADEQTPRSVAVGLGIVVEGGLAGLAFGLGWLFGQPPAQTLRADARGLGLGVLATLPLLVLFAWSYRSRLAPLARIRSFFTRVVEPMFARCSVADLALIAIAAGFGEELLFRGVLQAALSRQLGPAAGLASASLLFGLLHPITPAYIALAGLMGAYLGLVWVLTGNLMVAVVAHALYDFLVLVYLLRVHPRVPHPAEPPSAAD